MLVRPALYILLLLMLQACETIHLRALSEPATELDPTRQAISKRLAGVNVTVQVEAWNHRPRRLTHDFLPFLVRIANQAEGDVSLRLAEAILSDDQGRTQHSLRPEEVVSLLLDRKNASAIVPWVGIEATAPDPTIFGFELGLQWGRNRDLRDIPVLAFPAGPIPAGSSAEGFLYFSNPPSDARRLTLLLPLDTPSGLLPLSFSYAMER